MKTIFYAFIYFLFPAIVFAQSNFSGKVVEAGSARPIIAASVFIGNSSAGTSTDESGNFILSKVPDGKFNLVVSSIGYETFVKQIETGKISGPFTIELVHKTAALGEVVVSAAEKNGWIYWGDTFLRAFIGTSGYARQCRIKNPKVLKFRKNNKNNTLKVWADEPLLIENNALGYIITYNLMDFNFNLDDNSVSFSGYPLFSIMDIKNANTAARIKRNRQNVYAISLMHFIRSLYSNNFIEEGFRIVRTVNKVQTDLQKRSVIAPLYMGIEKFDTVYEINNQGALINIVPVQLGETKFNDVNSVAGQLSIGSVIHEQEDNKFLDFSDTLQVVYTRAATPFEYQEFDKNNNNNAVILSAISFIQPRPVMIYANGSYLPTANLRLSGFWAWWEKIAIMLPYDYVPD